MHHYVPKNIYEMHELYSPYLNKRAKRKKLQLFTNILVCLSRFSMHSFFSCNSHDQKENENFSNFHMETILSASNTIKGILIGTFMIISKAEK